MTDHHKDEALRIEVKQNILETDFSGNDIDSSVEIERRAHDGTFWTSYLTIQAEVLGCYHPGDREEPPSYPEVQIVSVEEDEKLGVQFVLTDREEDNIKCLLFEEYESFWASYVADQWYATYDEE